MSSETILITGAAGQIGSDLGTALRARYGKDRVLCTDIRIPENIEEGVIFEKLDVTDFEALSTLCEKQGVTQIYHLAAILSAKGEANPLLTWDINMKTLLNVLEVAKAHKIKVFYPSSIAVFGPETPAKETPQHTILTPRTVYGITKQAGENWSKYYFDKFGVDVRSIRYPGLISYTAPAGGGTTDYAVDIFHKALENGSYECFLSEGTYLPMMYMPDAINATIELMEAPAEQIKNRWAYNLAGLSFSPKEITEALQKHLPGFSISYKPDFRQEIADTWPDSIDDSDAKRDWNKQKVHDLDAMTADMLLNLRRIKGIAVDGEVV